MAITSGFATIQKQKMGILDLANQGRSKNPFFPLRSLHISSSGLTFRGFQIWVNENMEECGGVEIEEETRKCHWEAYPNGALYSQLNLPLY